MIALIALGFFFLIKGVDRANTAECYEWKKESKEYINYYFTDWQLAQCEALGVDLHD